MDWEAIGSITVSSYDSNAIVLPDLIASPLIRVQGLNFNPSQTEYSKLGKIKLLTVDGDEAYETQIYRKNSIIETPQWLNLFRISFLPEKWINNARIQLHKASNVRYYIWNQEDMATLRQLIDVAGNVSAIQGDVSSLNSRVDALEGDQVAQVDLNFGAILEADGTYGYPHVILNHGLNDPAPLVQFLNASSEAELLAWTKIDNNSIVVDLRGASSTPDTAWKAVITGSAVQSNGD